MASSCKMKSASRLRSNALRLFSSSARVRSQGAIASLCVGVLLTSSKGPKDHSSCSAAPEEYASRGMGSSSRKILLSPWLKIGPEV